MDQLASLALSDQDCLVVINFFRVKNKCLQQQCHVGLMGLISGPRAEPLATHVFTQSQMRLQQNRESSHAETNTLPTGDCGVTTRGTVGKNSTVYVS